MLKAPKENTMLLLVRIVWRHQMMIAHRAAAAAAVGVVDEHKMA
jgi:hypothetical protein